MPPIENDFHYYGSALPSLRLNAALAYSTKSMVVPSGYLSDGP